MLLDDMRKRIKELENLGYHDFCDDEEKMYDFTNLDMDEFLESYSYLTEEEYDLTLCKEILKIAVDNK